MDDLLKEAIADAKAVRETALENAKIALEDADVLITKIPHPSPASPLANRDKGEYWKNIAKNEISSHM